MPSCDASARFAAGLRAAGIERERRIALVMLDTVDFPIAFWGALRAGVVPVPINTLLPADITGYILRDSRAAALFVSAPLLEPLRPALRPAGLGRSSSARRTAKGGEFAAFPRRSAGKRAGRPNARPTRSRSGSIRRARPAMPKGVRHVHSSLRATADTYGAQVLGIAARRSDVLGRQIVLCLRARQFDDVPDGGRRRRRCCCPTGRPRMRCWRRCGAPADDLRRRADALRGAAGASRDRPGAGSDRLRRCISAGEPLPEHIGLRWRETVGSDILDGIGSTEMLHIFLSNRPDDIRYGTTGKAVPGYELRIVDEAGGEVGRRRNRRAGGARARAPPTATGTSATSRAAPSAASGPIPATPISATPTAITAIAGAATTC